MLVALSAIASEQASPTRAKMKKVDQFLDYVASQKQAVLTYEASGMVLKVHSDASYLSESKARSRAGGHFFMSKDVSYPPNNGSVLNIAQITKTIMYSVAETEIGAMYVNAREGVPARQRLNEMGHHQPRTPMQTDNTAAHSIITNNVQPKRTKEMDTPFHWLQCRDAQEQLIYYWRPGSQNWADYWIKHFPASHHINMRSELLTPARNLEDLKGQRMKSILAVKLAQVLADSSPAMRLC